MSARQSPQGPRACPSCPSSQRGNVYGLHPKTHCPTGSEAQAPVWKAALWCPLAWHVFALVTLLALFQGDSWVAFSMSGKVQTHSPGLPSAAHTDLYPSCLPAVGAEQNGVSRHYCAWLPSGLGSHTGVHIRSFCILLLPHTLNILKISCLSPLLSIYSSS